MSNRRRSAVWLVMAFIGASGVLCSCLDENQNNEAILVQTKDEKSNELLENVEIKTETQAPSTTLVVVHICGQVKNPGVYELTSGDRVVDLIEQAGGLTKEAADEYVNQARTLVDGEQIYIPTKEEAITKGSDLVQPIEETKEDHTKDKIDINNATKEELMTLPGIGESKATAIISYREKVGSFQNVEEIMNIEGIKEGVYSKIKELITIG